VVVRRYSYLREHSPGVYNPVDATLAWYRPGDDGKVLHATVSKLPPFKVRRYGLGYDESVVAYPDGELVSLDAKGVYFSGQSESALYLLHDDGKVEKIAPQNPLFGVVVPVGQDTALTAIASQHVVLTWLKKEVATWMVNDGASIFDFGGRAALAQTAAWLEPPRAWAVPIQRGPDPAEWFPLATQRSLGRVPRSCGAQRGPYRYVAPPDKASQRAVTIDVDGTHVRLTTNEAVIRSGPTPDGACMVALDAVPNASTDRYHALVFPDDLGHSVLFGVSDSVTQVREMECTWVQ
jgi:hypothetical protein